MYFNTKCCLNARQAEWSAKLAEFQYSIHYRPGSKMGKPDTLTYKDNEEIKAGIEHHLFDISQLNAIYLTNYAKEHMADKPIVVIY